MRRSEVEIISNPWEELGGDNSGGILGNGVNTKANLVVSSIRMLIP